MAVLIGITPAMRRLYPFRSTEETKVECTLVPARNASMTQSRRDLAGLPHARGRGLLSYADGHPRREIEPRVRCTVSRPERR